MTKRSKLDIRRRRYGMAGLAGGALAVAAVTVATGPAAAAPAAAGHTAADRPAVASVFLSSGNTLTRAVGLNRAGVVVGTAGAVGHSDAEGWRWLPGPRGSYVGQRLTVPAGTTGVDVQGVNDRGEAAGTLITSSGSQPVRWTAAGTGTVSLGPANSEVSAVGRDDWGVFTPGVMIDYGNAELVARDGARTPLTVTDAPETPDRVDAESIGGPRAVLLSAQTGVGRSGLSRPTVWVDGRTATLPVYSVWLVGDACTSEIRPDGTVAYSGPIGYDDQGPIDVVGVHRGGVPGTNVPLPTGGRTATMLCQSADSMASDGSIAGQLPATDTQPAAAALWRGGKLITIAPRAGETAVSARAVASGGRVVILATNTDGSQHLYLWHNGIRTPLTLPAGWVLDYTTQIVGMTDGGLVVGNLRDAAGDRRPVIWRTNGAGH